MALCRSLEQSIGSESRYQVDILSVCSPDSRKMLESMEHPQIGYRIVELDLKSLPGVDSRNTSSLRGIVPFLHDLLPDRSHTLYLDFDTLVMKDLSLFLGHLGDSPISSSRLYIPKKRALKIGIPYNSAFDPYVMLLNLDIIRRDGFGDSLREGAGGDFLELYNAVFSGFVDYLPREFTLQVNPIIRGDVVKEVIGPYGLPMNSSIERMLESALVLNFDTKYKPWDRHVPVFTRLCSHYMDVSKAESPWTAIPNIIRMFASEGESGVSIVISVPPGTSSADLDRTVSSAVYQSLTPVEIVVVCPDNDPRLDRYDGVSVRDDFSFLPSGDRVILLEAPDYLQQDALYVLSRHNINRESIYATDYFVVSGRDSEYRRLGDPRSLHDRFAFLSGFSPFVFPRSVIASEGFDSVRLASLALREGFEYVSEPLFYFSGSENPDRPRYAVLESALQDAKVSVVIPVFNGAPYLEESIGSLAAQTFSDLEVVCVNDCSDDGTLGMLLDLSKRFPLTIVSFGINYGPGPCRNVGFRYIHGEYVMFLDADDVFRPDMVESLYELAKNRSADVAICKSDELDDLTGKVSYNEGMYREWMLGGRSSFTWEDVPQYVFNFCNGWAWDKMVSVRMIREKGLRFENMRRNQDMAFTYMCLVHSRNTCFLDRSLIEHRRNIATSQEKKAVLYPLTVYQVGLAWKRYLQEAGVYEALYQSYANRMVSALAYTMRMCSEDPPLYDYMKRRMREDIVPELGLDLYHDEIYYDYVRGHLRALKKAVEEDYQSVSGGGGVFFELSSGYLKSVVGKEVVVSLTSYPARIDTVHLTVRSLMDQTVKADRIVLWLSEDQFPGRVLPEALCSIGEPFEVRWCDDLKPHKKYYYALEEFPDAVLVTVDDDVRYQPDLLERLLNSYVRFPRAVSAMRVNLVTREPDGSISPYRRWKRQFSADMFEPRMDLLATGVGGVLYPPGCLDDVVFDRSRIERSCLYADDLWLKYAEVLKGTPVVLASDRFVCDTIEGTQDDSLYSRNLLRSENDDYLEAILSEDDGSFVMGVFSQPPQISLSSGLVSRWERGTSHVAGSWAGSQHSNLDVELKIARYYSDKDPKAAFFLYSDAVRGGAVWAVGEMFDMFVRFCSDDLFDSMYKLLYGMRDIRAARERLAVLCVLGEGAKRNPEMAWELMEGSDEFSFPVKMSEDLYFEGSERSLKLAVSITEWMSSHGNRHSLFRLAQMYRNGKGVRRDLLRSKEIMAMAIDAGHSGAVKEMAILESEIEAEKEKAKASEATIVDLWSQGTEESLAKMRGLCRRYHPFSDVAREYLSRIEDVGRTEETI